MRRRRHRGRSTHAAPGSVAQQVGPGLGGLAVAVSHRDQFLGAVLPHAHDDQHAGLGLREADAQVDAVGPHVDVVGGGQVALAERLVVGLPLRGQPGDGGGRQPGGGAEELLQRGYEVARGQAVEVEQGQHLADLRGLAAPGRQDRRGEPLALAGRLVDALVVHPWRLHLDGPGRSSDRPGLVVAVADHEPSPVLVALVGQLGYVGVDFGLQGGGQHPAGAIADDSIDQGAVRRGAIGVDYAEHGQAFPTRAATRAYSIPVDRSLGKVRRSRINPSPIHR